MNGQNSKALGQQLMDAMKKAIDLQNATSDPAQHQQLSALHKKLSAEVDRLVDAALDESTKEYESAFTGLDRACALADQGIRDVTFLQTAIDGLAKAADMVAKVAAV